MEMNPSPLHIVILAAGEGKRMQSARPKVLLPLAGKPLLAHVLDTARTLQPAKIHVVFGHGGEQLRAAFAAQSDLGWIEQARQRGTGHAMQLAMAADSGCRSHPCAVRRRADDSQRHVARAGGNDWRCVSVLTAQPANPAGYGRVVVNAMNRVLGIVEDKDCSPEQRAIGTINTGVICADATALRRWLGRLDNRNAQREFYLTDVFGFAAAEGNSARCHWL